MDELKYGNELSIKESLSKVNSKYKEEFNRLVDLYNSELINLMIEGMSRMSETLRERDKEIINLSATSQVTLELEKKANEAKDFLDWCREKNYVNLEGMPKMLRDSYDEANATMKEYEQAKRKNLKQKEVCIYTQIMRDKVLICPSIYFDDIEKNPSLMLNFLEYCLATCEDVGLETSLPENEGGYVKIGVLHSKLSSDEIEKKIKEIFSNGKPRGFDEANLELIVISGSDYDPFLINNISFKIESNNEDFYSVKEAAEILRDKMGSPNDVDMFINILKSHIDKSFLQCEKNGGYHIRKSEFNKFLEIEMIEKNIKILQKNGKYYLTKDETMQLLGVKSMFIKQRIREKEFIQDGSGHITTSSIFKYVSVHPQAFYNMGAD